MLRPREPRRCPMCKEVSQGPGCCEASLKAELWQLHSRRDGLKASFKNRQTPQLQRLLLENTEDIAALRSMLAEFAPQEPPRLAGGSTSA